MKKFNFLLLIILLFSVNLSFFAKKANADSPLLNLSILTGYNAGLGLNANLTLRSFADEFPFELRLGTGYTFMNPGNTMDARRIFINNATNGVAEEYGGNFDLRFDFLRPSSIFKIDDSYFVFGPRYSMFKGKFKYVGGNEEFDVKSQQWGIGLGIENHLKMTNKLDLIFAYGVDYYFPSTLTGHDTKYKPDNDNVNPRKNAGNNDVNFRYKDADSAINQPRLMPRLMLGVSFDL